MKTGLEARYQYDTKVTMCANGYIELKQYKKKIVTTLEDFENAEDKKKPSKIKSKLKEIEVEAEEEKEKNIRHDSLSRTRNTMIEYACQNASYWRSFDTFTFAEDISIEDANKCFANFIRQTKRKKADLKYICIPEFTKRGRPHYHMISNLECGIDIPKKERKKIKSEGVYRSIEYYDIPYWSYGFSLAENIQAFDDNFNIALYLCKYLYKDMDNRLWGHQKILKSNNLEKPNIYLTQSETYEEALAYLMQKGYNIAPYEYRPIEQYRIPFDKVTLTLNRQEEYITLEKKLQANSIVI